MTDDTVELKPCPFCGGDYQTWSHVRDGRSLGCSKCGARFTQYNGRDIIEERLAALWNTRAAMPQQEVTVKDAIRWLKLIRDQDQGCGGRLNPQEIYLAMQREANNALSALSGQDAEGET